MVRTWPSLGGRAHLATKLIGEVALAVMLGVALAASWRDGVPNDGYVGLVGPIKSGIALMQVSGNNLYSGKPFLVPKPPVAAPIVQRPIPTSLPVRLLVPSLNIHPPVESLGLDRFGAMDTPENIWDVGWYNVGPVPGAPGDAVINGHAGYPGQPLIFGRLVNLQPGEQIVVVLADGSQQVFSVDSVASYPVASMPPGMFEPYGPPRLTLVTCDGKFNDTNKTYANRLVVEASYVGTAAAA
ncbi:MAG TPA: class F sortase [Candidatus Dormibacteraeota bacterium]|nr:class F sortase [Candidatus Dormibacteraeota bacterium]